MEHRIPVRQGGFGVDGVVVGVDAQPGGAGGEAAVFPRRPLHGGTAVVTGAGAQNPVSLFLAQALVPQDVVIVDALHVLVLGQVGEVGVGHAQLLPLVDVGGAPQAVDGGGQHLGRPHPVFPFVPEAGDDAGLVMVAPEQGVPAAPRLHAQLPVGEEFFQFPEAVCFQGPLVPVLVVGFQVVEAEYHGQLVPVGAGVAHAVVQAGGGHLPHRDHVLVLAEAPLVEHPQVFVDAGTVGVEAAAVPLVVVLQGPGLGDEVHHIEPEGPHAPAGPEVQHGEEFFPQVGVVPVQVRLGHVKEVEVVFAHFRAVFPGVAAELGHPVGGRGAGFPVPPDVVVLVFFLPGQGAAEPGVGGGSVVEHHVQHDADAPLFPFPAEGLEVLHGAVDGVDGAVVGHIVAVVPLGAGVDGGQPQVVHPQPGQVVQPGGQARQVADAVAVGILKALDIDLIDDLAAQIGLFHHGDASFLLFRG